MANDSVSDGRLASKHLRRSQSQNTLRRVQEHQLATNWAGLAVAEVLTLDLNDAPTKQRIKQMLAAWIANGHFKVRRDPAEREDKKYIVVADETTAPV
jgi:hypothetical protein